MKNKIDFVILWVDGNDPKWLEEKTKYTEKKINDISNQNNRFRDWELLNYWFRGVEKYATWVNKIHFVTCGHVPKWLNINHPKINVVKHEEFIPKEYLPTYNSNVIQYYLDRIEGLSERFIMFDDDQFILGNVKEEDFFIGDNIRDEYGENPIFTSRLGDVYPHSLMNNMGCINDNYSKRKLYKKNFRKYFSVKNGLKNNIRTLCLLPWSYFVGFYNPHICQCYTKEAYKKFWELCKNELEQASKNKFRKENDLTTFLIRYLILMEGKYIPRSHKFGRRMELGNNNEKIYNAIKKSKYKVLCINDSSMDIDFEEIKKELEICFESIFPNKSKFEK